MSYSLRDLFRRWKVRTSYLLSSRESALHARAKDEPFRPRLTLLEDKAMPSTTAATLTVPTLTTTGVFDIVAGNTAAAPAGISTAAVTSPYVFFTGPDITETPNRLFQDINGNGSQDVGEPAAGNVVVQLVDSSNTVLGTVTTDTNGNFFFGSSAGSSNANSAYNLSLVPGATYQLRVAANQSPTGNLAVTSDPAPKTATDVVFGGATADISGKVWTDTNGNGRFDAGDTLVGGVTVFLLDSTNVVLDARVTAGDGTYSFIMIPPGTYSIRFDSLSLPPGSVFTTQNAPGSTAADNSDADPATGQTAQLTLAMGDVAANIDAGAYVPVIIGDFAWNDLNANGIQDSGEGGEAGVVVNLLNSVGTIVATQTTDATGLYLFNVAPGQYRIEFVAPPGRNISPQNAPGSNATNNSDPDPVTGRTALITFNSGALDVDIDAGFSAAAAGTGSIGDFVWLDSNNNGIQDPGEFGVPNAKVNLLDGAGNVIASTTPNNVGFYQFSGLAAGQYIVEFVSTAAFFFIGKQNQGSDPKIDSDPNPVTGRTAVITLAAGEVNNNIDCALVKPLSGLVGNFVWDDTNCNGIQDAGELGVGNVTVNLLDNLGDVVATTTTDAGGLYTFTNVPAGSYQVEVILPPGLMFSPQNQGADPNLDSDVDPVTGRTVLFTIAAGQIDAGRDAGVCTIPVLGTIGDLVFIDANNNGIQDPQDFGLPNIVVNLLDGSGNFISTTTTNAAGNYLFTGLAAGNYIVEVIVPAGVGVSPQNQGGDDKVDSDINPATGQTSVITLSAGQVNLDVDAGLTKVQTVVLGDFVWNDLNCNGIQDVGEPGVGNVTVNLYDGAGNFVTTTTTDGSGKYNFLGLAAGSYQVEFILPTGFVFTAPNQGGDDTVDSDANQTTGRTQVVTLAPGASDLTLDAGLCAVAALGDFVWNDLNQNGIQDAGEPGVANVTVMLLDSGGNTLSTQQTDANGKYLFTNLAPGTYSVMFTLPAGFVFTLQNQGGDDAIDSDANPLTGKTGQYTLMPNETNLTVDAGIYQPGPNLYKLGDRVFLDTNCNGIQDAGESGVANVTVNLLDANGNVIGTTTTDPTGMYMFSNLPAGTYEVQFVAPQGLAFTQANAGGNDVVDSDANPVTGRTGTFALNADNLTVDAGLVVLKNISGFVYVDANDNGVFDPGETPIANVSIMLTGTNDLGNPVMLSGTTDANGQYVFASIRPGTYTITEKQPKGYLDGKDTLGTPFPGVVGNDVISNIIVDCDNQNIFGMNYNFGELLPASLQGKVYGDFNNNGIPDPGEPGIAGAVLTLTGVDDRGNNVTRTLYSGPDGTYIFTGLRPGTYKVTETQPPNWLDGKDRAGSQGGDVTNDMVSNIPITQGVVAINYDFGELIGGIDDMSKRELLASTTNTTPRLNGQAAAMPANPTYGNAVASTKLYDPAIPQYVVTSPDAGSAPIVRVFDFGTGTTKYTITAYSGFQGGVRTAVGDVTGDGIPDIITAPGFGGGPHIKVFDGATGSLVAEFFAYAASFTGGV
ncbi:MAG: carboxypeptidase regulatory-like domain-containing protein, partial [Gemmataceae bacterium]|nr:carboxypeptidase regulatory-like domain-containing protein [Gemmataceae bacterium]